MLRPLISESSCEFVSSMASVALLLKSGSALSQQFLRIQLPLAPLPGPVEEEEAYIMPQPLPRQFAHINATLQRIVAAGEREQLPLVAFVVDAGMIQVACPRAALGAVFKSLYKQQKELGVTIKDVQSNVLGQPMSQQELNQACSKAVLASLLQRGWSQLGDTHVVSGNLLGLADGGGHEMGSVRLHAQVHQPDTITLLLKPEVVRFRHPAALGAEVVDMDHLRRQLQGSLCTVLPDFREGLICGVHPVDPATLEHIRPVWASHGFSLPAAVPYFVDVSFDCDPDAPSFPYPPCCVLSSTGLDPVHTRLDNSHVQSMLARIRDDLAQTSFAFWGPSNLTLVQARVWFPDGPLAHLQSRQPALLLQTARELAQPAANKAAAAAAGLALGDTIEIGGCSIGAGEGSSDAGSALGPRPKKVHAHAGPSLAKLLQTLEQENTSAIVKKPPKAALPTATTPAAARLIPAPGDKPAVPMFKSTAPPKPVKAATAGQKRPASINPADKAKAKVAKAAQLATPGAAAIGDGVAGPAPAAAKPTVPRALKAGKQSAPAAGSAGAAAELAAAGAVQAVHAGGAAQGDPAVGAAAAKPPKPRAPKPELVLELVLGKVHSSHAAGTLSTLTIPELKCYLKNVKKPVGGKKAELEERVRQHLASEGSQNHRHAVAGRSRRGTTLVLHTEARAQA